MKKTLTLDDFFEVSRDLEQFGAVFYKFWELGRPVFSDEVATASVRFNTSGHYLELLLNEDFWNSCSRYKRAFVIAHECLHVVLNHGIRAFASDKADREIVNTALDVIVNEHLVRYFGFDREKVDPTGEYFWMNNVFSNQSISHDENFEFYYQILRKGKAENNELEPLAPMGTTVDQHDGLDRTLCTMAVEALNESISDVDKDCISSFVKKHFEKDEDSSGLDAGTDGGNGWVFIDPKRRIAPKKKWETVIRKWTRKNLRDDFRYEESWLNMNRRMSELPEELALPVEVLRDENEEKGKIPVLFFLDTSGSCSGLSERFWRAARSIPTDRFDLRCFCFDTDVYEVNLKDGRLYGFGGTSFYIIENKIQDLMNDGVIRRYPEAVFIITDGYGGDVSPEKPQNWYWFMTSEHSTRYVPDGSKVYKLSEFE